MARGTVTYEAVTAAAQLAYSSGLCVVPPREDGSKAPLSEWKQWQTTRPDRTQMAAWYNNQRQGIGVITGAVSHGLECTEFDDTDTYDEFMKAIGPAGIEPLVTRIEQGYSERSPSGGVHWFYFCEEVEGNTKLARRPKRDDEKQHPKDNVKVLIETRGEGGFVITAPSFGSIHNTGNPYVVMHGSFASIATITPAERKELHRFARAFDQLPIELPIERRTEERTGRPGDDFNGRAVWDDILAPHGWTRVFRRGATTYWRRPGKRDGISASTNHDGSDLFYVFSSSTEFETERGYSKFAVYAKLEFKDNFPDAAKRLATDGYGIKQMPHDEARDDMARYATFSDAGDAELFAHMFGERSIYDWERERFFFWQKHRWEPDPDGERFRLALDVARARKMAAIPMPLGAERKALEEHAKRLESMARRKSMLEAVQSLPAITSRGGRWDANPNLLGVQNGSVDLLTGTIRPGRPTDYITMSTGLAFNPEEPCPRWERFLIEVFGQADVIEFIQRAVGYSLTGSTREQVMFLCHGKGANGKSTFLTILRALAGEYSTNIASDTIKKKHGGQDSHPAEIATLISKRLVTCSETPEAASINDERIKALVGGDVQTARFMRGNPFTFRPVLKLWLATNHLPRVQDDSDGFWRRMRLIPFEHEFKGSERDTSLEEKLMAELPGILAWAVRGAVKWYERGLEAPLSVMLATLEYRNNSDPLADFITERCIVGQGLKCASGELYKAYQAWAEGQGMGKHDIVTATTFGVRMGERYIKGRGHGGTKLYIGVRVRHEDDPVTGYNPPFELAGDGLAGDALLSEKVPLYSTRVSGSTGQPVTPSPDIIICLCPGRHGDDEFPCPGAEWWIDGAGIYHCPVCHPIPVIAEGNA
jgi:P4 family phage/plasmid primase-like protien